MELIDLNELPLLSRWFVQEPTHQKSTSSDDAIKDEPLPSPVTTIKAKPTKIKTSVEAIMYATKQVPLLSRNAANMIKILAQEADAYNGHVELIRRFAALLSPKECQSVVEVLEASRLVEVIVFRTGDLELVKILNVIGVRLPIHHCLMTLMRPGGPYHNLGITLSATRHVGVETTFKRVLKWHRRCKNAFHQWLEWLFPKATRHEWLTHPNRGILLEALQYRLVGPVAEDEFAIHWILSHIGNIRVSPPPLMDASTSDVVASSRVDGGPMCLSLVELLLSEISNVSLKQSTLLALFASHQTLSLDIDTTMKVKVAMQACQFIFAEICNAMLKMGSGLVQFNRLQTAFGLRILPVLSAEQRVMVMCECLFIGNTAFLDAIGWFTDESEDVSSSDSDVSIHSSTNESDAHDMTDEIWKTFFGYSDCASNASALNNQTPKGCLVAPSRDAIWSTFFCQYSDIFEGMKELLFHARVDTWPWILSHLPNHVQTVGYGDDETLAKMNAAADEETALFDEWDMATAFDRAAKVIRNASSNATAT
jgi:hypothetical protein